MSLVPRHSLVPTRTLPRVGTSEHLGTRLERLIVQEKRRIRYISDAMRSTKFKKITPVQDISMIQTLCDLLNALLTPKNTPPDTAKEVYELIFVFAAIWSFGGFLYQDQVHVFVSVCVCV